MGKKGTSFLQYQCRHTVKKGSRVSDRCTDPLCVGSVNVACRPGCPSSGYNDCLHFMQHFFGRSSKGPRPHQGLNPAGFIRDDLLTRQAGLRLGTQNRPDGRRDLPRGTPDPIQGQSDWNPSDLIRSDLIRAPPPDLGSLVEPPGRAAKGCRGRSAMNTAGRAAKRNLAVIPGSPPILSDLWSDPNGFELTRRVTHQCKPVQPITIASELYGDSTSSTCAAYEPLPTPLPSNAPVHAPGVPRSGQPVALQVAQLISLPSTTIDVRSNAPPLLPYQPVVDSKYDAQVTQTPTPAPNEGQRPYPGAASGCPPPTPVQTQGPTPTMKYNPGPNHDRRPPCDLRSDHQVNPHHPELPPDDDNGLGQPAAPKDYP
ncbi:hypothetical protein BDK51DRAFT_41631 [Blyttiomyces helicus]|uniref:Uncharacterized protein n=1 Tax=Blyttiomyces helicus TaxID=388810 RepID=A0A4P9VYG5_9FUNG|nr:hypothetical protein BDK51DRAFT_41631 [Blyttiomyces helicus]|eukprot:RKO84312.1 hypothetical protein BDK51DRAFT_41631 [Blyttiomyces helicus]